MPRIARVVAIGYPHHITQRGNYRQDIFLDDRDRKYYLALLKKESSNYGLELLAYCLMTNHVHLIGVPHQENSLAQVFKYVNMKYAQYFNQKRRTGGGHLWQGRFFSCVLDESYLVACVRYMERNPVRAKMVAQACEWPWSSARIHSGLDEKDLLDVMRLFHHIDYPPGSQWKGFIEESDRMDHIQVIRSHTMKGRPLGSAGFVGQLEEKLGRILKLAPRGRRPRKVNELAGK